MKKITAVLCLLAALSVNGQARKAGIYLTYDDYLHNKLSYETDNCKGIILNEFFDAPFISIKNNNQKIQLKKDSIYGITTCNNQLLRFYNNEAYTLTEKGAIWIFTKSINEHQNKSIVSNKQYFFSTNGNDKLKKLTISNLKKSFINNIKLHDLLDVEFKHDDQLTAYDNAHHLYKVDELIEAAIK